jgi:hypothetical protein
MPHTPATQLGVAPPGVGQTLPQVPQWLTLVWVLTSHPLAALPSQLAKPPEQTMPQVPPLHVAVPLLLLHTLPHAPQFATLVPVETSQPLAALLSQSA